MNLITNKKYKPNIIGQGSFGTVVQVSKTSVKKILNWISFNQNDAIIIDNSIREISFYQLLKRLSSNSSSLYNFSKQIPSCFNLSKNIFRENETFEIDLDYLGITLSDFTFRNKNEILQVIFEIVKGLTWLHENNLSHGDLKPDNILLKRLSDGFISVSIIDFGSICYFHGLKNYKQRCTLVYCSPEELLDNVYSVSNDMWSLGTIIFEIVSKKIFVIEALKSFGIKKDNLKDIADGLNDETKNKSIANILHNVYKQINFSHINSIVQDNIKDNDLKTLVLHLLLKDPLVRITSKRLSNDNLFAKWFTLTLNNDTNQPELNFNLVTYDEMDYQQKASGQLRIKILLTIKKMIEDFDKDWFGHSVMIFDRFNLRYGQDVEDLDYNLLSFSCIILSGLILGGKTFSLNSVLEYLKNGEWCKYVKRRDFVEVLILVMDTLNWQIFNLSPDLIFISECNSRVEIEKQFDVYKNYVVNSQTSKKISEILIGNKNK